MPQKIQATDIEMTPLNSQQENGISSVVYIPNATRSNWLTRRNVFIGTTLTLGIGAAIGITIYLTNKMFAETSVNQPMSSNDTELFMNQSSRSLWHLYKHVEETDFTYCASDFIKHWEDFKGCGTSLCHCVRNARDVFEKYCHIYAQNAPLSECQDVANTIQRCKEFMSRDYSDC